MPAISNTEIEQILNPETNFINDIEKCVEQGCDIFDCMIEWTTKRKIEFEQIVPIIKSNQLFKLKVTESAEKLNFLKKKR